MNKSILYCWEDGRLEIGPDCPKGAFPLFFGPADKLQRAIAMSAEKSWKIKEETFTYYVPGIRNCSIGKNKRQYAVKFMEKLDRLFKAK